MWGDEQVRRLDCRTVYSPARRYVERLIARDLDRWGSVDDDVLRGGILRPVRGEPGEMLDSIDPEVVDEAIGDAMLGRKPRY